MKLVKTALIFSAFLLTSVASVNAMTLGTGSKTGVFYPFGQEICARAMETFANCEAIESAGSGFNVKQIADGKMGSGLAMGPVADDSGLPHIDTNLGEGSFIVANQVVTDRVLGLVGGKEVAVYSAALKLAAQGRVVFVTIGEGSGETKIMRAQLEKVGAEKTSLVVVSDDNELLETVKANNRAFGYFNRAPLSSNSIFVSSVDMKLNLMGAFNPALKIPGTVVSEVTVAGVTVKTPITPISLVYADAENLDVKAAIAAAKEVTLEDLKPKEKKAKKWGKALLAKFSKWKSQITVMSGDAISSLSAEIDKAVSAIKL